MSDRSQRDDLPSILRAAMTRALEWRLLVLFTGAVLATTAVAAFPAWRVVAGAVDRSPRAKEIAQSFDLLAFADIGVAFFHSAAPVTGAMAIATLLGALSWPFLAGMGVSAPPGARPRTFVEWIEGGVVYYLRMLRIGLVGIVPLAVTACAAGLALGGAREYGRRAILESQAALGWRAATVFTLLVFVAAHATIEAGRAAFGADDRLRSGWRAWLRGAELLGRHPLRVMGAYLGPTLLSYLVAVPLFVARLRLSGPSAIELGAVFVLTQLTVATLGWGRTARLLALTSLSRCHAPAAMTPADVAEAIPGDVHVVRSATSVVSPRGSA